MANRDFYLESANARLMQLQAQEAATLADLAAHRANGDQDSAAISLQELANARQEAAALVNLQNQYIASQQPPQQEQLTPEERNARPWNKMTYDDALALARQSKYGRDLDWNNPDVQAGYYEANRRRQRGE